MLRKAIALVFVGLLLASCAQKKVTKPEAEQPAVKQPAQEAPKAPPAKAEEVEKKPAEEQVAKVETAEAEEKYREAAGITFSDVYFDFDRYEIREDSMPTLKELASFLVKGPNRVLIEGHCDDRGTNEYNLALGDRRASSVKSYLIASGVPKDKMDAISYGEEKPLCKEQEESCWSKNRRAHFVILETGK
jgi:peptidoglycan-associated lipoprotein